MKYLAPGVYAEEIPGNDKPIAGSNTSTALMLGVTERGPVNVATPISSVAAFRQIFGGKLDHRIYTEGRYALPYAAEGFFDNGGQQLVVWRLLGPDATCAETVIYVELGDSASASKLSLQRNRRVPRRRSVMQVPFLRIRARSPGHWGNQLRVRVPHVSMPLTLSAAAGGAGSPEYSLIVERIVDGRVVESEVFDHLGLLPSHARYGPRIVGGFDADNGVSLHAGESQLVCLSDLLAESTSSVPAQTSIDYDALLSASEAVYQLKNGTDDLVNLDDSTYIRALQDEERAARQQSQKAMVNLVSVPGHTSVKVQTELVRICETMRYRFAVLDAPRSATLSDIVGHRQRFDSLQGAIYYPWLLVSDPFGMSSDLLAVPPAGHVMGVYARTETARGIWKSPANEPLNGVAGLEHMVGSREQEVFNPLGINVLRDFRDSGRGIRVWGARTLSSSSEWTYVNVRRLALYIGQAVEQGLQFVAFEANTPVLWTRVRLLVSNFLYTLWREGGLAGARQQDAFFVNVGYNVTMTQADIDSGRMVIEAGFAAVKPAEFIILRINLSTL